MLNRSQIEAPPIAPAAPPSVASARADIDASELHDRNDASDCAATTISTPPEVDFIEQVDASEGVKLASDSTWLHRISHPTPAVLISFILHTLGLLLLAMVTFTQRVGLPHAFDFESVTSDGESDSDIQTLEILSAGGPAAPAADLVMDVKTDRAPSGEVFDQVIGELTNADAATKPPKPAGASLSNNLARATGDLSVATLASTGVEGRSMENREKTARARGGTLESELAVERALEWLAAHQGPRGGWSLVHDGGKCGGQCKNNGSDARYEPAATGLALLAFLGAGYTHKSGKHQRTVNNGVYYLLQIMEEVNNSGSFLHQSDRGMYNHGIATFALCEAYQLSGDEDLKAPAQQAVNFIFSAQNYAGGWGYLPKQPGDLTISGWQMMAIKSAYAAGLEVPASVIIRIDNFLDTKQVPSGIFYGYAKPAADPTCSAIGMLLRLFRGWSHTDPRALELAQFLVKQGKSNNDVYYNYYATLLLFHLGGPAWETWNPRVREHLIRTQSQSGHEAGSWYFEDQYAKEGGRLYTTAMSAMTLEVYYRFAPLYQQSDKAFEL